jgi:hypothetical protein
MPAQPIPNPATPIPAKGDGDQKILGNGQPDSPQLTGGDGRTTAIFPPPRTDDCRCLQPPQDDLDEALMQSFPCSDPPSHSRCHA